jgi:hypothetical protein
MSAEFRVEVESIGINLAWHSSRMLYTVDRSSSRQMSHVFDLKILDLKEKTNLVHPEATVDRENIEKMSLNSGRPLRSGVARTRSPQKDIHGEK